MGNFQSENLREGQQMLLTTRCRCFFYNGYVHVAEIKWKQKTVGAMHGMKEQYTLLGAAGIRPRGQI
ncbi:hypothetical protein BRADI_4g04246v3 [Brachypodium distachyon]|uniref:Uncharacterized protein n=1 Tax=Brachypodium distachyon TaxID=15368 RepID=A0A0Q3GZ84_BRADI|nr:hypothetical protein BRADI_4g04246v3 [Brachypodium distachyon]